MTTTEQRLATLVSAPPPVPPGAMVDPVLIAGRAAYVSGQVAFDGDRPPLSGKVGADITTDQAAVEAAKAVANALYRLADAVGSLDAVVQVMKLTVFVNAVDGFTEHPQVANGASRVLHEMLGERGRHARAAVGVASLPLGVPVEVDLVATVRD